jgi:hypothetical protein
MNFKTVLILFLTIIFSHDLEAHEFYLSYTSVKHNSENEELFIRIKLFVNDLEESLFEYQSLDFQKNSPIENKENYIEKYIYSKLSISINEKPIDIQFIGQKLEKANLSEDSVIFCELEACNVHEIKTISIQNKLLTENFDSQANIVVISANGVRNTLNLDKRIPEGKITYN